MTNCLKCHSSKTKKNGSGRNQSQRFLCVECHSSFTLNGKRGTYSPEFKQEVVEAYCHQQHKAQAVVQDF